MRLILAPVAILLWHIANFLFSLSLDLHQRASTPFWRKVEVGWKKAEERLEEMEQLEHLAERGIEMTVRGNGYGGFLVGEGDVDTVAIVIRSDTGELYCWDCLAKGCVHIKVVEEFEARESRTE